MENDHILALDLLCKLGGDTGRMLVVGCCEDPIADIYTGKGWEVWGYDFRDYQDVNGNPQTPQFKFIKGDFLTAELPYEYFDVAVDVSAIHHFGLGYYGDPKNVRADNENDWFAVGRVIKSLKIGGHFVCVTDVGVWEPNGGGSNNGSHGHWRRYGLKQFKERVVRHLQPEHLSYWNREGTPITHVEAFAATEPPAVAAFVGKKLPRTLVGRK